MAKGRTKTTSFDAMVKFFMQKYNIPTKKDVARLMARLDRLENLMTQSVAGPYRGRTQGVGRKKNHQVAGDLVLDVIKRSRQGVGFPEIQAQTGFGEKKIRNIIFRLYKNGKIKRKSRGIYVAA